MATRLKFLVVTPLVLAVVVLLARVLPQYFLSEHDLPIIIDNGPVEVRRGVTYPTRHTDQHWELHHSDRLAHLYAWSWNGTNWTRMPNPVPLSGVDDIVFEVYDLDSATTATMTIRRDPFWDVTKWPQKVRVLSDVDFTWGGNAGDPVVPTNNRLRIHAITTRGQQRVCFRNNAEKPMPPGGSACLDDYPPQGIFVSICTKPNECQAPTTGPAVQP